MLRACRRLLKPNGRMAFTTLATSPGLRSQGRERLRGMSPGKVFAPGAYGAMLRHAGFNAVTERDVTRQFASTLERWIASYRRHRTALARQIGEDGVAGGIAWYGNRLRAVREGLIRRMLYVAER